MVIEQSNEAIRKLLIETFATWQTENSTVVTHDNKT